MHKIVAGVQTNVDFADNQSNVNRMLQWLSSPQLAEADLIVFPECMVSGYCFDSLEEAWPHAQTIPGPATASIAAWCAESKKSVVFGLLEQGGDGKLYNSCVLVGPSGLIAAYRKIHLPHLGVDRFTTSGPDPYEVHHAGDIRVGMHICYDGSFPESSRILALEGADILVLPTNWPPGADTFARYIPNARALENNVYFMSVNRVGNERGFRFIGQSRICDTNGNSIAEAPEDGESIILAKIDLERARNKNIVRVPGKHVINRWKDRHPEFYSPITKHPK